jgi:DNA polymerase-3 subunit epsilon
MILWKRIKKNNKETGMQKLIFIDTETTGGDRENAGVWQIGGIIECGKRSEEFLFECDIFEQDVFDPVVTEVTGITLDKLTKLADPGETYDKFVAMLDKYVDKYDKKDKFHAIAYGADFDSAILRNWFLKNDDDYFGSWFWHPWLCMMYFAAMALRNDRSEMNNFKLETVAEYLGIKVDPEKTHNALYDAELAREIYYKII